MRSPNINYLWAELIVEELTRCGVRKFCISPGSRNSPLVLAAAENSNAETVVHPDERGAAFFAVGYAKATGGPAALICTSGSAAANYLPAAVEASMSCVPLVMLSADRPVELRETASNQTIDQVGIYGRYAKWAFDLPSPNGKIPAEFVLTTVDQAVYRARRAPAGPVQLNCMIPEPLAPEIDGSIPRLCLDRVQDWQNHDSPYTTYLPAVPTPDDGSLEEVRRAVRSSKNGVIVCGTLTGPADLHDVYEFAGAAGMPILADISSGLRCRSRQESNLITHYDLFLRDRRYLERCEPDLIVRLGGPIVSKALNEYVENARADHIVVDRTPFRQDPGHSVTLRIEMEPWRFCASMLGTDYKCGSALLTLFRRSDEVCSDLLNKLMAANCLSNGFAAAYNLLGMLPGDSGLFLANSMPVRDADGCGVVLPDSVRIGVNRGASGIDGNVASAVGFADGLSMRSVLLIGDLAFLHDLNSLLLARNSAVPLTVVILSDDGGGMFSYLPIADYEEHFERFFGAAHGVDFKEAASLFGLECLRPETGSQLRDCLTSALGRTSGNSLIEIRMDRRRSVAEHKRIWKTVADEVQRVIL